MLSVVMYLRRSSDRQPLSRYLHGPCKERPVHLSSSTSSRSNNADHSSVTRRQTTPRHAVGRRH